VTERGDVLQWFDGTDDADAAATVAPVAVTPAAELEARAAVTSRVRRTRTRMATSVGSNGTTGAGPMAGRHDDDH
jgi:hypothetical protein